MLVGHLLCGLMLGTVVAGLSLSAGYPIWAALAFYVISVNLGLFGSILIRSAGERPKLNRSEGPREPFSTPSA